ncbi:MAG: hypothetical protein LAO51_11615 [Acidobacteriia bacterium]|nr:hypothetical protein [Terriglobia bacterium]
MSTDRRPTPPRVSPLPLLAVLAALAAGAARAEPYLAVRTGLKCSSCHANLTGGGLRTAYGSGYGRLELPAAGASAAGAFDGVLAPRVRVGADLRGGAEETRPEEGPSLWSFDVFGARIYGDLEVLEDRLSIYVDEQVAPGASASREAFALLRPARGSLWVKVGRFFPPFGLRLEDDVAFTRSATGFNFASSDTGVEVGVEPGPWSIAAAVTNGAGLSADNNNGKQVSLVGSYVRRGFRVGLTAARDDLPENARQSLAGAFGGLRAGPVVLLAELDTIRDDPGAGAPSVDGNASHVEADWLLTRGVTLRAWGGRHDPDRNAGGDTETQIGLGVDWTTWPGLQLRGYVRRRVGPASVPAGRGDEGVLEIHLYF